MKTKKFAKGGGLQKSISDVSLKLDDVTEDKEHGNWTQLCSEHGEISEKSKEGYLSPEGEGSGTCGVVGCDKESEYYFNFKIEKPHKGGGVGEKYDNIDYNDAHDLIDSEFTEEGIDEGATREDYEGLAIILYNLRKNGISGTDLYEDNKVSDYTTSLSSKYKNKMAKGGGVGELKEGDIVKIISGANRGLKG